MNFLRANHPLVVFIETGHDAAPVSNQMEGIYADTVVNKIMLGMRETEFSLAEYALMRGKFTLALHIMREANQWPSELENLTQRIMQGLLRYPQAKDEAVVALLNAVFYGQPEHGRRFEEADVDKAKQELAEFAFKQNRSTLLANTIRTQNEASNLLIKHTSHALAALQSHDTSSFYKDKKVPNDCLKLLRNRLEIEDRGWWALVKMWAKPNNPPDFIMAARKLFNEGVSTKHDWTNNPTLRVWIAQRQEEQALQVQAAQTRKTESAAATPEPRRSTRPRQT